MIIEVRNSKDDSFNRTIASRDIIALTHTDELNGADMLSITTLAPLEPGQHLVLKIAGRLKEYTVQAPKATREGATVVYSDTALASIVDLFGVQPLYLGEDYTMQAKAVLEKALAPAGVWRVEFPDGGGDTTIAIISDLHYKSAREIVAKVAAAGGFEIETYLDDEADKRVIVMHKHRGSSEPTARFSFGKNLLKVERTQRAPEMTACYGFLKADYHGERHQPLYSYECKINKDADEHYAKRSCGGHVVGVYTSEEEDATKVERETEGYLADHSVPQVTYEASVLELTHDNVPVQSVQVGDTVDIVDPTFKPTLRCRGRITKLESDLLSERTTVTLGNISRDLGDVIQGRNSKLQSSIAQAESAAQNVQKAGEARMKNIENQLKELDEHVGLFRYDTYRKDLLDMRLDIVKIKERLDEIAKGRWN